MRHPDAARGAPVRGFEERSAGARYLLVAAAYRDAVERLGLPEPDAARRLLAGEAAAAGRSRTAIVSLSERAPRVHLRPLRHGGLLGSFWRGALLGVGRPVRELEATAKLRAAGAPVPEPVLVACWRLAGPFWSAVVGTVHVEESRDGVALLESDPDPDRVLRAAAAAGRAVRRFHDAGGRHADLHVKNLIFREGAGATAAWIVDLDNARAAAPPPARRRARELMRLYRSLVKRGLLRCVGTRGCARFFEAYADGDRALRGALRPHLRRERLRVALHALAYSR
ncbi:MAG TPA: lipopolysaccharide kinase InaA family protein [Myxococcota bacterium]